jgi:hypothetical protein
MVTTVRLQSPGAGLVVGGLAQVSQTDQAGADQKVKAAGVLVTTSVSAGLAYAAIAAGATGLVAFGAAMTLAGAPVLVTLSFISLSGAMSDSEFSDVTDAVGFASSPGGLFGFTGMVLAGADYKQALRVSKVTSFAERALTTAIGTKPATDFLSGFEYGSLLAEGTGLALPPNLPASVPRKAPHGGGGAADRQSSRLDNTLNERRMEMNRRDPPAREPTPRMREPPRREPPRRSEPPSRAPTPKPGNGDRIGSGKLG